jgi:hypothetical protein
MNLSRERKFEALEPVQWLAPMSDHIRDSSRHRTLLDGH